MFCAFMAAEFDAVEGSGTADDRSPVICVDVRGLEAEDPEADDEDDGLLDLDCVGNIGRLEEAFDDDIGNLLTK